MRSTRRSTQTKQHGNTSLQPAEQTLKNESSACYNSLTLGVMSKNSLPWRRGAGHKNGCRRRADPLPAGRQLLGAPVKALQATVMASEKLDRD